MIENGATPLNAIHIKVICTTFNVNEEWLREGLEPIFNASKEEEEMAIIYKKLNPSSQRMALKIMRVLYASQENEKE